MTTPATLKVTAFLRMRAASCVAQDGKRGMVLVLRDTGGLFPDGLSAQWLGDDASSFYQRHQDQLTPGRCLDLEIYHLRATHTELRARVKTCQSAPLPPSWLKHAERQSQPIQPHHQDHTA